MTRFGMFLGVLVLGIVLAGCASGRKHHAALQGIKVTGFGPTQDGYLQVGVSSSVAKAQPKLDAIYGPGVIRVVKQATVIAF